MIWNTYTHHHQTSVVANRNAQQLGPKCCCNASSVWSITNKKRTFEYYQKNPYIAGVLINTLWIYGTGNAVSFNSLVHHRKSSITCIPRIKWTLTLYNQKNYFSFPLHPVKHIVVCKWQPKMLVWDLVLVWTPWFAKESLNIWHYFYVWIYQYKNVLYIH